jgi:hypothetical protein
MRICLFLLLFYAAGSLASDLILTNAANLPVHNETDYLSWVPDELIGEDERAELREKGVVSVSDHVTEFGSYYYLRKFQSGSVVVKSSLWVIARTEDASLKMHRVINEAIAATRHHGGRLETLECENGLFEECRFEVIQNAEGLPVGNLLFVRSGGTFYAVTIAGLGGFQESQDIFSFLGEKAEEVLKFKPDSQVISGVLSKVAESQRMAEARDSGRFIGIFVLYGLVYILGYWLTAGLNRIAKKELVGRRSAALVATFALAVVLVAKAVNVVASSEHFSELPPFDQGKIHGRLLGELLLPFVLVCLCVAYAKWQEKKRAFAA